MHEWSGTNVKKENIKPTPITNERYESLTKRHCPPSPAFQPTFIRPAQWSTPGDLFARPWHSLITADISQAVG